MCVLKGIVSKPGFFRSTYLLENQFDIFSMNHWHNTRLLAPRECELNIQYILTLKYFQCVLSIQVA